LCSSLGTGRVVIVMGRTCNIVVTRNRYKIFVGKALQKETISKTKILQGNVNTFSAGLIYQGFTLNATV
jgi:hypothetical protein